MFERGRPARAAPSRLLELNAPFCLGETRHYFNQCDLFRSFHAIVEVQFRGLARLDRAINSYKDNLNSLYRHPDLTLTVDRALRNVIVSAYSHFIDTWAMNGACSSSPCILAATGVENDTMPRSAEGRGFPIQCHHQPLTSTPSSLTKKRI